MRAARERESGSGVTEHNMETLGLMQEMMAPPHHNEELVKPPPPGSTRDQGGNEFHGLGNAPQHTNDFQVDDEVKPKSWGTGEVATPERGLNLPENPRSPPQRQLEQLLYQGQLGPHSPGGDSNHSYSSEIEAEERQARARVNHVRRSFDSRPTSTVDGHQQKQLALTDGGRESGGYSDDYENAAPAPINIAELQAANRRALTPAGPVPRPSEAQRLQMHSRGGARRAAPGSMAGPAEAFFNNSANGGGNDSSWLATVADPHVPVPAPEEDTGRPWGGMAFAGGSGGDAGAGGGFRVEYEVDRSPTQGQQQFARQQSDLNQQVQMQMQGAAPPVMAQQVQPHAQSHVRSFNSPERDRSFVIPAHGASFGNASQHTLDGIDEENGSEHGSVRPKLGPSASLERQLERREREIHSLRMQCTAMAKTLQREGLSVSGSPNESGSVQDNMSLHGNTPPQQQLNFSPPRSTHRGSSSPARGMVPSPPIGMMHMQPQNAWSSSPPGPNAVGAPGSMTAMAAAAVAGGGAGDKSTDPSSGWDDARPIDRMEAAERVNDAIQSLRRSVRWCCVDLRRDGDGAAAASYRAGDGSGPGETSKGRELRGRIRHSLLLLLFVISGVVRLLLLLLWKSERSSITGVAADAADRAMGSSIGTDNRRWRVVLLLHAVVLGSCAWQCMAGLGLFGVELREWEVALINDVHTHGDVRLVEGWLRRGKRYANLGVLVSLCWGGLVIFGIWGGVVKEAERREMMFLWAWPLEDLVIAPTIATVHVVVATAMLAPLALLPRLPLALAHAALLRTHRERLVRSLLLDGQGFGGNSRALIVGKASEAAERYRAICTSVVVYSAALDGGSGLTVALAFDMAAALVAVYLLAVEPAAVGTLWLGTCVLLLARGVVQWPTLLRIVASLSRYEGLQQALLASSGTTIAAAAAQGGSQQQAAVDEMALHQLVYTQRPAVSLCGGCVVLGWPLLGGCLAAFGVVLVAGVMV